MPSGVKMFASANAASGWPLTLNHTSGLRDAFLILEFHVDRARHRPPVVSGRTVAATPRLAESRRAGCGEPPWTDGGRVTRGAFAMRRATLGACLHVYLRQLTVIPAPAGNPLWHCRPSGVLTCAPSARSRAADAPRGRAYDCEGVSAVYSNRSQF